MKKKNILSCLSLGAIALLMASCSSQASVTSKIDNLTNEKPTSTDVSTNNNPTNGNSGNDQTVNNPDDVIEENDNDTQDAQTDHVDFSLTSVQDENTLKLAQENVEDGFENSSQDTGWQNVETSFSLNNKFGDSSKASLMLKPSGNKHSQLNYFVSFLTNPGSSILDKNNIDFRSGLLTFDYKPVNVTNPDTVILYSMKSDWSTYKYVSVKCQATRDGWYRCVFDLSSFGFTDDLEVIRFNIGFSVNEETKSSARFYLDNMKIHNTSIETVDDSLENMTRDIGWEKCNVSADYYMTANAASLNSYKLTFNGKASDVNKNFICLSPQNQKLDMKCNDGVLEAKFHFSDPDAFTTKKILLVLVDSGWAAARTKVQTTYIGDGWYLFKADLSNITYDTKDAAFDPSKNLIRLGFGFPDLTSDNKDDKAVWIDDVKVSPTSCVNSGVNIWQAYNTETVLQNETISGRTVTSSSPLSFEDARNSTDSTQLMLSPSSDITFDFKPECLYNNNGDVINPENIEVLVAKYIYVGEKSIEKGKDGWKGVGYYPDALVPIKNIIAKGENTVTAGNTQTIWVNVTIPSSQEAGDYNGYGVLTINGTKYSVPMHVKVHNAVLPNGSHNKSSFLTWDDQTLIGEGEINKDMRTQYYIDALSKGINPGELRDLNSGSASFAENFADYIANDPRITTYRFPASKDDSGIVNESSCLEYLDALIAKNIEVWESGNQVNFFDKLIFYVNDEPLTPDGSSSQSSDVNKKSQAQWACVKQNNTIIKNCKEALKSKLANYPELYNSFVNMRNVLPMDVAADKISGDTYRYGTWNLYKDTYPNYFNTEYMDTPCPAYHHLTDASVREKYASTFNHTWFYGCLLPQLPYPGYHIDNSLLNERLVPWMQYDYNFEGQVYWVTNFYQQDGTDGFVNRDVWTDCYTCGSCCGDGALTYPGVKYDVFGPISTLRFETIRNSFKDYEYFYLFDQNIENYKSKTGSTVANCRSYLASAYAEMFNGTAIKTSYTSSVFETVRIDLLNQLDIGY